MYEKLEHAYFAELDSLLIDMEDDEFLSWIICESCTKQDYNCLISVLEEEQMYERIDMTINYLNSLQ